MKGYIYQLLLRGNTHLLVTMIAIIITADVLIPQGTTVYRETDTSRATQAKM